MYIHHHLGEIFSCLTHVLYHEWYSDISISAGRNNVWIVSNDSQVRRNQIPAAVNQILVADLRIKLMLFQKTCCLFYVRFSQVMPLTDVSVMRVLSRKIQEISCTSSKHFACWLQSVISLIDISSINQYKIWTFPFDHAEKSMSNNLNFKNLSWYIELYICVYAARFWAPESGSFPSNTVRW